MYGDPIATGNLIDCTPEESHVVRHRASSELKSGNERVAG